MATVPDVESMSSKELLETIESLEIRNEQLTDYLSESVAMSQAQLAIDDIGWKPLGGIADGTDELNLDTIKRVAELCRALVTINPLVKRGVAIRSGYIWGRGVEIVPQRNTLGRPSRNVQLPQSVRRIMGTTLAQLELERAAATDGNLFFLIDPRRRMAERIPLSQISGAITRSGDNENILYYKRTWNDEEVDLSTGAVTNQGALQERWIPSSKYEGPYQSSIQGTQVDSTRRIVHVAFNKQVGWRWGVPDVIAVVWWVKAYKEFLENSATLTKAYARFAWKVTSSTGRGQSRVASQLAAAPSRDPATGQPMSVGASVSMGAGQDLTAIQRNTSVDFDAGRPLAAMIAAGLEVPLPALTSDPSAGSRASAETLDDPTILAMLARQQIMDDAFTEIFELVRIRAAILWPEISPEPMHRRIQAADMAGRSGVFSAMEWRAILKDNLGDKWKNLPDEVPDIEDMPRILQSMAQEPTAPEQVDPMSRGDHELRDEGGQAHVDDE